MTNNVKSLKKQLMAAIAMVVVAAIALSSATYAWFVNNATVKATGAAVKASTAYSLLISNDGTSFYTSTEFDSLLTTLVPVSTNGTLESTARTYITGDSNKNDGIATDKFDLLFATSNEWKDNYVISYTEVGKNTPYSDTTDTDDDTDTKYFYNDTIYLKAAQDGNIYLDSSAIGIEWADWDATNNEVSKETTLYTFEDFLDISDASTSSTDNEVISAVSDYNVKLAQAKGLLKTLRVGFVVTYPKDNTETLVGTYIYQLVSSNLEGYVNTTAKNDDNSAVWTGVSATKAEAGAEGIKGAVSVAPSDHAITVTTSNLTESDSNAVSDVKTLTSDGVPVISGIQGSSNSLATATDSDVAIVPQAIKNTIYTVDVYIWMEGCDVDTAAATLSQFAGGEIDGFQFGFCLGAVSE